ncbi:methylamine utilization protein MauD [Novosphingobium album (ex Liu et al. 2023)]|uniref:Methylamine utilization protein MauD n=1 Tax=Novosphingobium album (ex Liu et al. 2023) TaxID=3031130 RepID=A0ABT5WUN5_9SPHN|nr:methylamine utilization protein MauD [Novosphingobium album (ex Liu et al. 2023)]MDE8653593.1 methylamine utilization protein MauD [Novosphingobium album (ex Liu et al. 2023)]
MLVPLLFLLGLCVILLVVAVLALRRQLRLARQAMAPVGTPRPGGGPHPAEPAPIVSAPSLAGETLTIGGVSREPRPLLLVFIEAGCGLCETVIGDAVDLCRRADVRLLFLGDGRTEDYAGLIRRNGLKESHFILSGAIGDDFLIGPVPAAALIDADGQLVARGTVQRREQLEALLAREAGPESVSAGSASRHAASPVSDLPNSDSPVPDLSVEYDLDPKVVPAS